MPQAPEAEPKITPDEFSSSSEGQKDLSRPSAQEIYQQVASNAREELSRTSVALAISALAGGIFMGLSALGNAIAVSMWGDSHLAPFVGKMFYPLGFIVVILGRAQLFTENTLYPVALVLAERRHLWQTLRLWGVVLPANMFGALAFASLATLTPALLPEFVLLELSRLGLEAANRPTSAIFWSGVMAGWIIAAAAWLISGSHSISGSILIIWMLTFVVGLGGKYAYPFLNVTPARSGEPLALNAAGITGSAIPDGSFQRSWETSASGVGLVTLLEYGQVISTQQ